MPQSAVFIYEQMHLRAVPTATNNVLVTCIHQRMNVASRCQLHIAMMAVRGVRTSVRSLNNILWVEFPDVE